MIENVQESVHVQCNIYCRRNNKISVLDCVQKNKIVHLLIHCQSLEKQIAHRSFFARAFLYLSALSTGDSFAQLEMETLKMQDWKLTESQR